MNPASVDLEAFAAWLERAGTSPHTRRAYLRLMQGFVGFLQESGRDVSAVLADEHERTFAARDWRQHLRHVRRLGPRLGEPGACGATYLLPVRRALGS
ncbi:MAG TPA: hypothetical protein VEZ12_04035 [Herpetosiphonaceae bacterium]|nr:hypothetical protein [Herpetosiphonaceae bacterium]